MKDTIKSMIKRVGSPLIDAAGVYDRQLASLLDVSGRFLVVMYHRVIDEPEGNINLDPFSLGMCVRQQHFAAQANYLKSRFHVMPLADLLGAVQRGETLPAATAAITFDDGYLDCLTHAAPVLRALELPATFFVSTGGLEHGRAFWWDRVIAAVADTNLNEVHLPELGLTEGLSLGRLNRRNSLNKMLEAVWAVPSADLSVTVDRLVDTLVPGQSYRLASEARAARMNIEQLKQLSAMGFDIGAHTVNHFDLRSLGPDAAHYELTESRSSLQKTLGKPISTFAYPSGLHNDRLHQAVRVAGFDCAVSADRGINSIHCKAFNRYAVHRVGMPDTGVADFKRALSSTPLAYGGKSA